MVSTYKKVRKRFGWVSGLVLTCNTDSIVITCLFIRKNAC